MKVFKNLIIKFSCHFVIFMFKYPSYRKSLIFEAFQPNSRLQSVLESS